MRLSIAQGEERIPLLMLLIWFLIVRMEPLFLFFPMYDSAAERDGWIAALVAILWVGAGSALIYALYRTFPGMTLAEGIEANLGPYIGKPINVIYSLFLLQIGATALFDLGQVMNAAVMPRTPAVAFLAPAVLVALFAVRGGVEVIGRTALLVFYGMITANLFIAVVLAKDMSVANIMPIAQEGIRPILQGSALAASRSLYLVPMMFLLKYTGPPTKKTLQALLATAGVSQVLVALTFILVTAVLSYDVASKTVFEYLAAVRYISVAGFLERVDAVLLIGWIALSFISVSTYLLAASLALKQALGLGDYRSVTFPLGLIMLSLSFVLFPGVRSRTAFIEHSAIPYDFVFEFGLPLVLLILCAWRGKTRDNLKETEVGANPPTWL